MIIYINILGKPSQKESEAGGGGSDRWGTRASKHHIVICEQILGVGLQTVWSNL